MTPIEFDTFVDEWNRHQQQTTPELHREIARWLQDRSRAGDKALLLLAFRNAGKSTLVGLYCAWLLHLEASTRILVLAADYALARKMVRNVKRVVERHPLTKELRPKNADEWASDQFTVARDRELRDPSMLAKGIGANVTGSRADVVICDDVEVPNTADTAAKRADLRERLEEIRYVLVPGGTVLYVGTPHSYYSIYAAEARPEADETEPFLAGFKRLELAVTDEQGRPRWPEKFDKKRIDAYRARSGLAKFQSQMMLRPVNVAEGRLDADKLQAYDDALDYREAGGEAMLMLGPRRLVSASCWWDPSYGAPDKGDASVVAALYTDKEGHRWLHAVRYLAFDPALLPRVDEATQLCRLVAAFVREHYLPAVTLETNGIGKFLPAILRRELKTAGVACRVAEKASRKAKDQRILDAFDDVLAAGRLHAHRDVWRTPLVAEMREWRPGSCAGDDGLDAVAGCLLAEPVRLPTRPPLTLADLKARPDWRQGARAYKARTEFEV